MRRGTGRRCQASLLSGKKYRRVVDFLLCFGIDTSETLFGGWAVVGEIEVFNLLIYIKKTPTF